MFLSVFMSYGQDKLDHLLTGDTIAAKGFTRDYLAPAQEWESIQYPVTEFQSASLGMNFSF